MSLYASVLGLRLRMFLEACHSEHQRVWVLDNRVVCISIFSARLRSRDFSIAYMDLRIDW